MPKIKLPLREKLKKYVRQFGIDKYSTDGKVILCKVCESSFTAKRKSQIKQHDCSKTHIELLSKFNPSKVPKQQLIANSISASSHSAFYSKLCRALVGSNIPLKKINHPLFREFLSDISKERIPDESTLRKNYLPKEYENVLTAIRSNIGNRNIWVQIDTTTDETGRHLGIVVVGALSKDEQIGPYVLHADSLERANHQTIARLFNDGLANLWPNRIEYDRVHLLLSDAAANMHKAATALQVRLFCYQYITMKKTFNLCFYLGELS